MSRTPEPTGCPRGPSPISAVLPRATSNSRAPISHGLLPALFAVAWIGCGSLDPGPESAPETDEMAEAGPDQQGVSAHPLAQQACIEADGACWNYVLFMPFSESRSDIELYEACMIEAECGEVLQSCREVGESCSADAEQPCSAVYPACLRAVFAGAAWSP